MRLDTEGSVRKPLQNSCKRRSEQRQEIAGMERRIDSKNIYRLNSAGPGDQLEVRIGVYKEREEL